MDFTLLKDFMDRLTSCGMPGNSISVCMNNQEIFRYTSGYSNIEEKIPMAENLGFNIYSCSKVATVTAALQLYEKGFFLLNDPIYDFIPEYGKMYIKNSRGDLVKAKNPITMRHLFTMTAGLDYNLNSDSIQIKAKKLTDGKMDTLTVARCIADEPLSFEPGTRWQYSLCHDVLAAVVEAISGKKFRDYVKENIFDPLGMKDSYYHNDNMTDKLCEQYRLEDPTETNLVSLQAFGSQKPDGHVVNTGKKVVYVLGPEYDSGGAGITTTVEDYTKFVSALANWGKGANGERILTKGTVDLLRTNQLSEEQSKSMIWSQLSGYGYGLGVRTMTNRALSGSNGSYGEFGWGGAAGATVLVDPDVGLSIFYARHMLNPQESYYQPRLRNIVYTCINS